jgi:thiosulfate/3-mercaptopyruvate sulfurtransferase
MTVTPRYAHPDAIADTRWLADNLRDPALRVFDCTIYLHFNIFPGLKAGDFRPLEGDVPPRP